MTTFAARAAAAGILVLALAGCVGGGPGGLPSGAPAPAATASPSPTPEPRYRATDGLAVGDCFDPILDHVDESLIAGQMLDCKDAHLMELYSEATYEAPDDAPYPGESQLDREAERLCRDAFRAYVGIDYDDSRLTASFYTPSASSWKYGDREILCVVEGTEAGPLTRSVKGFGA